MKRKYLYFIIIFLISLSTYSSSPNNFKKYDKVDKKLQTDAYSYLSPAEKEFIRDYYGETGVLLPTTKNKKEGEAYFNPSYGNYLNLSAAEKEDIGEIPLPIAVESSGTAAISNEDAYYPKLYDLRNVGGNQYITDLKNQGKLNLCWAFTTVEQAESYLMVKNNQPYNSSTKKFSVRQMDYATAKNSLLDYTGTSYLANVKYEGADTSGNDKPAINRHYVSYGWQNNQPVPRTVGESGNFLIAAKISAEGVTFTDENDWPYDTTTTRKELTDVLNYDNAQYELNSSVVYMQIGDSNTHTGLDANSPELANYKNKIKSLIMNNGGVYVASQSPGYDSNGYSRKCAYNLSGGDSIIRVDDSCEQDSSHAMQIIGWDDNYPYSYCKNGTRHVSPTGCSSANLVTGTGAWILRNSWGNNYSYIHLAYDTYYEAVYAGTNFTPMSSRNWDNSYIQHLNTGKFSVANGADVTFTKPIKTPEKVQKVKFHTFEDNVTATLSILSSSKNYNNIKQITVPEMGYATFDLSDLDIIVTDQNFEVYISTSDKKDIIPETVSVYTANYDSQPLMSGSHMSFNASNVGYAFRFDPLTKNIPSNTNITYQLKNLKGVDYTSKISSVTNSKIAENNMNANIYIDGSIPTGIYTFSAIYGSHSFDIKLFLGVSFTLSGKGTASDPFIINNEEQLRMMQVYLDSDYKLGADITLTDYWVPIGNEDNPFYGSLDGDGHTIYNLTVPSGYKYGGLFGYVKETNFETNNFKNLRIVNADIRGSTSAGALIGTITAQEGYSWDKPQVTTQIANVHVITSNVYSTTGTAGALIGTIAPTRNIYHGKHTYTLNRIFSSSNVGGYSASGLIGEIKGSYENDLTVTPTITLTNVENVGVINLNYLKNNSITPITGTHSSMLGKITRYGTYSINQYISSPLYLGFSNNRIYGSKDNNISYTDASTSTSVKGYNIHDGTTNVTLLKNNANYTSWTSFNNNWEIKTIDGVKRIPTIRGANITYTPTLSGVANGSTIQTTDTDLYIRNNTAIAGNPLYYRFYATSNSNSSVLGVQNIVDSTSEQIYDVGLIPIAGGTSTVHLVSNYDGYEADINYTVLGPITTFEIVNEHSVSLTVNNQHTITTNIAPSETFQSKTITWQSSNTAVATVNSNGVVTAKSVGNATITGSLQNGLTATLSVTVTQPIAITDIILSKSKIYLTPSSYKNITSIILPTNNTETVTWSSDNSNVATVNQNGRIYGYSVGTATVTASSPGGVIKTLTVVVEATQRQYLRGDADFDGDVDLNDVVTALRKIYNYDATDSDDRTVLDINNSGQIDLNDVVSILRYIYKYDTEL